MSDERDQSLSLSALKPLTPSHRSQSKEKQRSDYKLIAEVAATAGKIMLESHAESYRVEDTARRILQISGFSITEVISTTTGLFLTLDDDNPQIEAITLVRRIESRGNHLNKIYRVNNISRELTAGNITPEEAMRKLMVVDKSEYADFDIVTSTFLLVASTMVILNGTIEDIWGSLIAASIIIIAQAARRLLKMNDFMYSVFSTLFTAFFVNFLVDWIDFSMSRELIVIATLTPLYPGTAFTNGIRDTLKGDYTSGLARVADALVTAVSIGLGVAIGLYLYHEVKLWLF